MNKTEQIKSLIPKYEEGEITIDEIEQKVKCSRALIYRLIPVIHKAERLDYSIVDNRIAGIIFNYNQYKSKTIADWDSMTEIEKQKY